MSATPQSAVPSNLARLVHWIMAAMILGLFALGSALEEFPRGSARDFGMMLHQSFGLLFVALLLVRLGVRPTAATTGSAFGRWSARAMHAALYALMFATPLAGLGNQWARGRASDFFGMVMLPSPLAPDRALAKMFGEIHETAASAILVLAGFHALAALWHHFVRRDDVLRNMLPGNGRG
ncbi:MAG: cytochrome b [Rhodospirillales bacterium]